MKYLILLVAVLASACGADSPVAPTIPAANVNASGTLSVQGCLPGGNPNLIACVGYTGTVKNLGPGCATNVHGITKSFVVNTQNQIGTSEWSYPGQIKAGEEVSYSGLNLVVPAPLDSGWTYTTTATWDNVRCQ